jgi:iron complex outermembrane recepter protein
MHIIRAIHATILILSALLVTVFCQTGGTVKGVVTLEKNNSPLHNVSITIVQLSLTTETNDKGEYQFLQVPSGKYTMLVHMEGFPDVVRSIDVGDGTLTLDLQLKLSGVKEEVTITATGREQSTFESFQAVTAIGSTELVEKSHPSIGEVLNYQPGVAKRSFGPGSSRPVIRGFDGDRVLILQDGIRTGTLSSQSGDHGESIDVLSLDRLEVVKGPATLLYGSNAIGGVVNAVTTHHQVHDHPHEGLRGYVNTVLGSANAQAGAGGGFDYGVGNWLLWGSGSKQRTGNYQTPIGEIENSKASSNNVLGGFGWYGDRPFFNLSYGYDKGRYGIPFASLFEGAHEEEEEHEGEGEHGDIGIDFRRHNIRFNTGFRNIGSFIDGVRLSLNYSDWQHKEIEEDLVGTVFNNKQFIYRGTFEQRRQGRLSGSFGFWGLHRDYKAIGEESLTPPVKQNAFALFGLEEIDLRRVRLQFGGRLEHNSYDPQELQARSFTGFSGAAGIHLPLWKGGALVTNYTHSYRAPSLEELYNNGPHLGNLTFEIGNANLQRESNDGIDLSLRHSSERLRTELNLYYYNLKDFIFLAPTDEIEDGLRVADYVQGNSRFVGSEIELDLGLHKNLWLNLGLDTVDAELKESGTPLPRIPPLRGRVGFDMWYKSLNVRPQVILVKDQDQTFINETRTAGYTLFNLRGSYTIASEHFAHIFSANAFNLGNRLYRNHLSFIKDLAPEIGRGVRFSYALKFF